MRSALHDVLVCQRRLGLTAIEVSEGNGGGLRLRPATWSTHILFWTLQVALLLATGSYIIFWNFKFEFTHTGMANHYAHVTEVMEPVSIVLLIAWLRLHQDRLLQLLNQLLELLETEQLRDTTPNWINFVFLSSNFILNFFTITYMVTQSVFDVLRMIPLITFSLRQIYFSCLVNIFLVTVHQIEAILDAQLLKVKKSVRNRDLRELGQSLQLIDYIFRLCELQMNVIFSVPLCLHFLYIVLETASIGYIIALLFDDAFMIGISVIIIVPLVIYAALPTSRNHRLNNVVSIEQQKIDN